MSMDFATLTLTRQVACPPARLFHLMTDPGARAMWSAPTEGAVVEIDHSDIRPGGREVARCGPKANPEFTVTADFHVVAPDERLICSETLEIGGEILSVSLATMEVSGSEAASDLTVTLQVASLAGPDMAGEYQTGWSAALENLAGLAETEEV